MISFQSSSALALLMLLTFFFFGETAFAQTVTQPTEPAVEKADQGEKTGDTEKPKALSRREVFKRLLNATVRIVAPQSAQVANTGTGWLVDEKRKLIVTNWHVVENADQVKVKFPVYKDGVLNADPVYYETRVLPIDGTVLDIDSNIDLALIRLKEIPKYAKELPLAKASAQPGDQIHAVGGKPKGTLGMWIYARGVVRGVYDGKNVIGGYCRIQDSDIPINKGNSGGAILDDFGRIVGVAHGMDLDSRAVTHNIDLHTLKQYLDEVLPLVDPKTAEAFNLRGVRLLDEGRTERSLADFHEALKLDRKLTVAVYNRGVAFLESEDYRSAIADFTEVIRQDSMDGDAYERRGEAYRQLKKYDESIKDLTDAIRLRAGSKYGFDAYFLRGLSYLDAGKPKLALEDINLAIEKAVKFEKALGGVNRTLDRVKFIELSRTAADYFVARGDVHLQMEEYDRALGDFKSALNLRPNDADTINRMGDVFFSAEKYQDSLPYYLQAIKLNPKNDLFWYNHGSALLEMENYKAAVADLSKAIELAPKDGYNWNRLAIAFDRLEENEKALKLYTKAIELTPDVADFWANRASVYAELGQHESAADEYTRAIKLDDSKPEYFGNRGDAYAAIGKRDAAVADFNKACEIDPNYKRFYERLLRVENRSPEPIRVYVVYQSRVNGKWQWSPAAPSKNKALAFDIQPGKKTLLLDGKKQIQGYRVRIWAVGHKTGDVWMGKDKDLYLVAEGVGYVSSEGIAVYDYSFTE